MDSNGYTDNARFEAACRAAAERIRASGGIGTMGEKGIHNALKHYYEPDESCHEIKVGGYVADILGENGIIEIQTRGFGTMREKLTAFLKFSRVTIVYPCVVQKYIIMLAPGTGEVLYRRKSPQKHSIYDIIRELWGIAPLLADERLEICIALLEADEYREKLAEPVRTKRRRGLKTFEKTENLPTALREEVWLRSLSDYAVFVPDTLSESFTSADYSAATGMRRFDAGSAVNLLTKLGVLERVGKKGNAYIYRRALVSQDIVF